MSWAKIKKSINSNISKSLDVLITEKCNELQSKLNSVYNTVTVTGNIPSVKSVQRGTTWFPDTSNNSVDITISSVNPDKSIVLLNESGFVTCSSKGAGYNLIAVLSNLQSTTITISTGSCDAYRDIVSWQVIEFY